MTTQNFERLMNLYGNIKSVCIIGAILFLIAAVTLFFVLKIPSVFGELTGRTAKKAIEAMTSAGNSEKLGASRKIGDDGLRRKSKITGILGTAKLRHKLSDNTGNIETDRLAGSTDTPRDGYFVHSDVSADDAVSKMPEPETTVLKQKIGRGGFMLEKSIVMIHTDEVM